MIPDEDFCREQGLRIAEGPGLQIGTRVTTIEGKRGFITGLRYRPTKTTIVSVPGVGTYTVGSNGFWEYELNYTRVWINEILVDVTPLK